MCAQTPTCSIACINICAHVKGHEIHVKSSMDYRNTKTPRKHRRLGSATLSQIAFPGESNPNLWREKSKWENTVVKKKKKKLSTWKCARTQYHWRQHSLKEKSATVYTMMRLSASVLWTCMSITYINIIRSAPDVMSTTVQSVVDRDLSSLDLTSPRFDLDNQQ